MEMTLESLSLQMSVIDVTVIPLLEELARVDGKSATDMCRRLRNPENGSVAPRGPEADERGP